MSDVFGVGKVSDYPTDYIPAGAKVITGIDYSDEGECTVKGFYDPKTGEYHIQEVVHNSACTDTQYKRR